jgi:DNA-binding response OmpR family regulator
MAEMGKNKQLHKIMLVEDDLDIQQVARIALEDVGGLNVQAFSRGQDALDALDVVQPDLVLLDVMMPGMDGPSTLQSLRQHDSWQQLPVVFMTAKAQSHEISKFTEMGALGVIVKPFNPMTLAEQVQAFWQKYQDDICAAADVT